MIDESRLENYFEDKSQIFLNKKDQVKYLTWSLCLYKVSYSYIFHLYPPAVL